MKSTTVLLPLTLAAAMLTGATGRAQDKTAEIDRMFNWATPATPGCAVAVSQHGKVLVNRAYGSADRERDVPITPASVFDAGSVVKQFVAAAVLLLVEDGRLSLSDDVRKYIPELPDTGHKIAIDHLLTHSGGVRDWTGIAPLAAGTPDALTITLRQRGLNFAPGEEWSYSNSGYVLLKEVVARTAGTSFSEFTRKRLFEPLGMKTTQYLSDMRQVVKNRALAYEKQGGQWKLDILLDNDRGGGGALLSTASDLLIWNDALTNGRLGAFVTGKLHEPATLNNGRKLGYARGVFLDKNRGGNVLWHTGSAAAYKTLVSRFPEHGLSVAMMCNSSDSTSPTMFAQRIFDLFVPATAAPSDDTQPVLAASGVPASKAGLFFNERTGEPLDLIVENGKLRVRGGPPLLSVADDRFRNPRGALRFMSQDEFELHFLSNGQLELKSMEGATTPFRRAEPYAPTPDELNAFAGRYESREIGSVFEVEPKGSALVMRLEHAPDRSLPLQPIDREIYQFRGMIIRFHRDKTGTVDSLIYSNPVLRNIKFARLR
jgi:CubicO group peptidase (beta-lactamase class C family)